VQSLAARRHHPEPRTRLDEVCHQRSGGDEPFEVVQHQQQLTVAERAHERLRGGLTRFLRETERPRDDGRHGVRVVDPREPHEERTVAVGRHDTPRDLHREPRLADTAWACQGKHAGARKRIENLEDLIPASDEWSARQREIAEPLRLKRREVEA
jgi:hypothetical protein